MNDRVNGREENPVASGLVALVAVAVVVGILAGIGALAATRMLGIDGSSNLAGGQPGAGDTLYLPPPSPTETASGPLVSLQPTETETPTGTATQRPTQRVTEANTEKADPDLNLTVGTTAVRAGENIQLSGTYVGGEGSVLDIYYNVDGGGWEEFPLDTNVSGGIFQTYVTTWMTGRVEWRVQDESSGRKSNVVVIQIA